MFLAKAPLVPSVLSSLNLEDGGFNGEGMVAIVEEN